ncbi:MAG: hypothetical protein NW241_15455 [Bacteroidia bacterium]|nr:hypothetical protein [Bacteroidia bacterium]
MILLLWAATGVLFAQPDPSGSPQTVYTGLYLMNVYDLNMNEHSFHADFYLWFRWTGDKDPMQIEFVNAVEKWSITQTVFYDSAVVLPDGSYYNGMRIEGRFYHPFVLNRFPLDRHQLQIQIEHTDYPADSLRFVPDTARSLYRPDMQLPGWKVQHAEVQMVDNRYQTDFGRADEGMRAFSEITFRLRLARPLSYFLLKLMLPLTVVVLASLGAFLITPSYIDARISLPIAGLLSAVFLQQSYSAALPDVGYMVLMDKIYLLSYVLIAGMLMRIIISSNQARLAPEEASLARILRRDLRLGFLFFGVYMLIWLALVLGG